MTNAESLEVRVALYLMVHEYEKDIAENKLMDFIRAYSSDILPELSRSEERIPEVAGILKKWVHAGLVSCKTESDGPTTFSVRDGLALETIVTDLTNRTRRSR